MGSRMPEAPFPRTRINYPFRAEAHTSGTIAMNQGTFPSPDDPGAEPATEPSTASTAVPTKGILLKKRQPIAAPTTAAVRDKVCARCGLPFRLDPGKKFFLCPDCYRREVAYKRKGTETRVMALISCVQCGKAEYLPFTPDDPKTALCRDCFREKKPEPKAAGPHR